MWILLLLCLVVCWSFECPKSCSSHSDCVGSNNSTLCCVSGLCHRAKLLPDGAACTVGRTQDQICAVNGGGECAAEYSFIDGLDSSSNASPDSLCVDNVCRFRKPVRAPPDIGCACDNYTRCESGDVCADGKCVSGNKKTGEACMTNLQCRDVPVCEQGICKGLPFNATCRYLPAACYADQCPNPCAAPYRCLASSQTCAMPLSEGASCLLQDCQEGLICIDGQCGRRRTLGQNCSYTVACEPPLFCAQLDQTCKARYSLPLDSPCSGHYECESRSCRGLLGPGKCAAGPVAGMVCDPVDAWNCGEGLTCDCKTRTCTAVPTCTAEELVWASKGFSDENLGIDVLCCKACRLGAYFGPYTLDCAKRTVGPPANPCSPHPQPVLKGCPEGGTSNAALALICKGWFYVGLATSLVLLQSMF